MINFLCGNIPAVIMAAVSAFCVFAEKLMDLRLRRLIRQASQLSHAEDAGLKQLRVRFESTYRINNGAVSAESMAANYVNGCRIGMLPLSVKESLPGIGASFCVSVMFLCASVSLSADVPWRDVPALVWGGFFACVNLLAGFLSKEHTAQIMKDALTDYMENTLSPRLGMENDRRMRQNSYTSIHDDIFMKNETGTSIELYSEPARQAAVTAEEAEDLRYERAGSKRRLVPGDEEFIARMISEYLRNRN